MGGGRIEQKRRNSRTGTAVEIAAGRDPGGGRRPDSEWGTCGKQTVRCTHVWNRARKTRVTVNQSRHNTFKKGKNRKAFVKIKRAFKIRAEKTQARTADGAHA